MMKAALLGAWPIFREEAQPVKITRVGLRYINRVLRLSKTEQPGYWLKESPSIPPVLLTSGEGFSHRLEVRLDEHNRLLTTIAHGIGPDAGPFGALFYDIDRVLERESEPSDDALSSTVEDLHEDVWKIFVEAKSENYDRLLNGEPI
jgi:uncharacterized protein (TIGR04255 family)